MRVAAPACKFAALLARLLALIFVFGRGIIIGFEA
jgi:hypothetical protein